MLDTMAVISRLEQTCRVLNTIADIDELKRAIVEETANGFRVDVVALYEKESPCKLELSAQREYPATADFQTVTTEEGIVGWVAQNLQSTLSPDVRADPRYANGIDGTRSEMAVPLVVGDKLLGVLDLQSRKPAAFNEHDLALLNAFGTMVAGRLSAAIENANMRDQLATWKTRAARLDLIHRVGATLIEGSNIEESMQQVVNMVAKTLDYTQIAVLLVDREMEELDVVAAYGFDEVTGLRIPLSQGATGYATRHAEPVNMGDVTTDPRYVKGISHCRSELAVPIVFDDEVIGVLDIESQKLNAFGDGDVKTLTVVASYTAAAIRTARLMEATERRNGGR